MKYWIDEYHIDGFRFDLMGVHDIETMQAIREMKAQGKVVESKIEGRCVVE